MQKVGRNAESEYICVFPLIFQALQYLKRHRLERILVNPIVKFELLLKIGLIVLYTLGRNANLNIKLELVVETECKIMIS